MKVTQNPSPNQNTHAIDKSQEAKSSGDTARARAAGTYSQISSDPDSSVEISDRARLMNQASSVAKAAPDVRADKIAALKQSIQNGSYQVDSGKVADRLVDEHFGSHFGKNHL